MDSQPNLQVSAALIEKFLSNKCTAEEAVWLTEYFERNPLLLNAILQNDWLSIDEKSLPGNISVDMLVAIKKKISSERVPVKRMYRYWMGAAASIILIALSAWLFVDKRESIKQQPIVSAKNKQPVDSWVWKYNTTAKDLLLPLPDGSLVTLAPEAGIKYKEKGDALVRDIILKGKAFFEVAKDTARPFTVYSGAFATTALGTSFSVKEDNNGCEVKLFTGKVVVRKMKATGKWKGNVYLLPGQQLLYDARNESVFAGAFRNNVEIKASTTGEHRQKRELAFDHDDLSRVLDQLAEHYNTPVTFDSIKVKDKYFTGIILPNDKLPVLLNAIAGMNGLEVIELPKGYRLQ